MIDLVFSQDTIPKVSIKFENLTRESVIKSIEAVSELDFFFNPSWMSKDSVSGNFKNQPIDKILSLLFKDTNLNYFLFDGNRVIITRNSIIYDELPEDFFGEKEGKLIKQIQNNNTNAPVFHRNQKTSKQEVKTYRIGKRTKEATLETYKLSGYIRNRKTEEPISNLSIVDIVTRKGTVTDSNGFYEINLSSGIHTLEMRALGIEKSQHQVIVYNEGKLDLELEESLEQLDEVIVRADAYENIKETAIGSEEIDVEESKNIPLVLGERDVLKVATALPGITTAGEGSAGFNVRGGKTDQNLILFDDAVIYNPQHFFGIFSALNPFAIGELNVYKGSMPAEYGGRLSSVFDIKTKNGNTESFSGEASIGPVTGNLLIETPILKEKSSLMLGGRGAYANWILRSLEDANLQNSEASFFDVLGSYSHEINENNNLKITAYASRDDFSITSDSLYVYQNRLASLKWNHRINENSSGSFSLAHSQYDFDIEFDGNSNNDFKLGYNLSETSTKLKMNYSNSSGFGVEYGLEGKLYNLEPGRINPLGQDSDVQPDRVDREKAFEAGVFVSGVYDITDKFSFNAGLRYSFFAALGETFETVYEEGVPRSELTIVDTIGFDKNEVVQFYNGPELRISGRYLVSPTFSVKAGYNNTFQYIHRLTNNTTISPIDTWKISDSNIRPQRGQQISLGLYKNFNVDEYEISLEGFYKKSDDILDFKTGAQLLLNENIETEVLQGEGKSYGVELLVRKNTGKLNGWLSYTFSRSLIRFASQFREETINNGAFFPSNFDKPHDFSLVANYKFTRRFSLATNLVYQTGRPVTIPVGDFGFNNSEFALFSNRNAFRIPDFYRLDLGFNIEGNHKIKKFAHSFWTISIYNVLGRNNPFSVFFVTENGNVRAAKSSIFSIPVPAITYNFKF